MRRLALAAALALIGSAYLTPATACNQDRLLSQCQAVCSRTTGQACIACYEALANCRPSPQMDPAFDYKIFDDSGPFWGQSQPRQRYQCKDYYVDGRYRNICGDFYD